MSGTPFGLALKVRLYAPSVTNKGGGSPTAGRVSAPSVVRPPGAADHGWSFAHPASFSRRRRLNAMLSGPAEVPQILAEKVLRMITPRIAGSA